MTTLQLINHIASRPELESIVLNDSDERTPMQAIECLSCEAFDNSWNVNSSLEINTLLASTTNAVNVYP